MDIRVIDGDLLIKMFKQGTFELNANKGLVDSLNVFPVPDGDTGTNMSLTMNAALTEMMKSEHANVETVAKALAKGSLMGARGNSGVILSQIFRGFAKGCEGKDVLTAVDLAGAFKQASETAYKAVMKPVEGTILTVIRKTADRAMEIAEIVESDEEATEDMAIHDFFACIIEKAEETLERTPEYLEVLKQAGVVDAGGKGLICIFKGLNDAVLGIEAADHELEAQMGMKSHSHESAQASFNTEDIKFAYCTEFIVDAGKEGNLPLKEEILKLGDSVVFVEDDGLIKIHVHTNNPGRALELAVEYGELLNIKIENMKQQHSTILEEEGTTPESAVVAEEPTKPYAFIGVAMGSGIAKILRDLGVDHIIEGGQTMNPSTEDIMKAVEGANAEQIFILPNNSNIILAAQQAQTLSDKSVHVVPSKTIPQGIAAMLVFDPSSEAEENLASMVDAVKEVKTVQVTYSVRDTVFNDLEIKKDDILGVAEGEIKSVGQNLHDVAIEALNDAIDEDAEIMTIYYGQDIDEAQAQELADELEEKYEDLEVEVYEGGQPLYYYICSIE